MAWGGAYDNTISPIVKLIAKLQDNLASGNFNALGLRKNYILESLLLHYNKLIKALSQSNSRTRNKTLQLPLIRKNIFKKSS